MNSGGRYVSPIPRDLLPDNCIDIVFDFVFRRAYFTGLWSKTSRFVVKGVTAFAGIRLHPAANHLLIQGNVNEFTDRCSLYDGFDLSEVCPGMKSLIERILNSDLNTGILSVFDRCLKDYFLSCSMNHTITGMLNIMINSGGMIGIQQLAGQINVSERHVNRLFNRHVGISPKKFARILRFQSILKMMQHNKSADFFKDYLECGYYDQSHFIKEFSEFVYESPKKIMKCPNFTIQS